MKAKDNIEELILKNRERLNEMEPTEGHFERFEAKLRLQQKKKKITLNVVWKVAVAIIFVLLATNQAFIYFSPNSQRSLFPAANKSEFTLSSVSPEYQEVEFYFTNSINNGMNQWNTLTEDGFISKEEQKMMDSEMDEFEELYKNLQKDLEANPNDERIINAMLEFYQAKLSVINIIVNKLQEVKQTNTSYETNNEI
ncbi:MAG: hypothetical protein HN778_06350 [Prolixibacteraceae bacterium]|jgi:hypothetical protein|nr:hypothetical protein [Prolixibacteraceae bacterium]MBT6007501.1 hypothetical protein [Prolixibacteraceae bacterium]MBT6765430.1 hypothetical protein [Prolixibacteraceae bacterium]MBT6997849.1 hypothetical protein [Prolixibacteraceae bacterium]MBT7394436.1 hypothetical protein [Prolixibacteraceae bacterium]